MYNVSKEYSINSLHTYVSFFLFNSYALIRTQEKLNKKYLTYSLSYLTRQICACIYIYIYNNTNQ